ncbi:MAG: hypothetical protein QF441_00560 [Bacteriovoracaceae bacterium]|jgi:hypothetical protein|nr:hypothetical protein [Halobacteriovoraceae bacterium]MDP7319060.1 hypothetical protein [Bacteriovoracaceae bacterium]
MQTKQVHHILMALSFLFILTGCKDEEFYEKEYIETLSDQYEKEKQRILDAQTNCKNAVEKNKLVSKIVKIDFPSAIECNFNETGVNADDLNEDMNGPRKNSAIRAKVRQDFKVDLEENITICDMNFDFPNQQMQYDDEIFLLLNDYVIISSQNYSKSDKHPNGLLTNTWGLQEFKWYGDNALYDLFYDWGYTSRYCLGVDPDDPNFDDKCSIPPTETVGAMRLEIPNEDIIKIGALAGAQEEAQESNENIEDLNFSFITTGDDDAGDCEHAAYGFEVELKYIQN